MYIYLRILHVILCFVYIKVSQYNWFLVHNSAVNFVKYFPDDSDYITFPSSTAHDLAKASPLITFLCWCLSNYFLSYKKIIMVIAVPVIGEKVIQIHD